MKKWKKNRKKQEAKKEEEKKGRNWKNTEEMGRN